MAKKKETRGRPTVKIDWNKVNELLLQGESGKNIAVFIGVSAPTLYSACKKTHGTGLPEYAKTVQPPLPKKEKIINGVSFKKKKTKKRSPGRPRAKIDWFIVGSLLKKGSKGTDVARHFGIHPDTFYKRCEEENKMVFSEFLQQNRGTRNVNLTTWQCDKAEEGNVTMLIWLGKQWLGQRDKDRESVKNENINENEYAKVAIRLAAELEEKNKILKNEIDQLKRRLDG